MAVGVIYRTSLAYNVHGQLCYNVMNFRQDGAGAETAQQVAVELAALLSPMWHSITNGGHTVLVGIRTQQWARIDPDIGEAPPTARSSGTANPSLAPTLAWVITLRTNFGGRSNRGRIYIAGLGQPETGGILTAPSSAVIVDFLTAMHTNFITGTPKYHLGVFSEHRWRTNLTATPNDCYKPVTSLTPRPILGTQRNRRPGVGS